MIDYKLIGSRLKTQRENSQLTQETLAEKVGITTVYLSRIENGRVRPTLDTLGDICNALSCDLGAILLDVSPESPNYQNEKIVQLFNTCSPAVKPVVLNIVAQMASL